VKAPAFPSSGGAGVGSVVMKRRTIFLGSIPEKIDFPFDKSMIIVV